MHVCMLVCCYDARRRWHGDPSSVRLGRLVHAAGEGAEAQRGEGEADVRDPAARLDGAMRLPNDAHTSRPWRIHEIAPDFRVEDVWALPTPGGPNDFRRLVDLIAARDPTHEAPAAVRALFALRWKIGGLLGWDDDRAGLGARV